MPGGGWFARDEKKSGGRRAVDADPIGARLPAAAV